MTLVIPNADKNLVDTLKAMNAKLAKPYELIEKEESKDDISKATKEAENGELNHYENFEEFKKAMSV